MRTKCSVLTLAWLMTAMAQTPDAANWPNVSAASHVFQRGDVEILTFETEQDYDKLQELYRQPVIYAHCFGGPTTFYIGTGEVDVLRVIGEMKRRFSVDPDRVYIMGHSMGGAGAYRVGLHYPDQFGGIEAGDPAMRARTGPAPEWMEPQVATQAIPKLYPSARNVDVFFKNAGAGIQRQNTEFADGIVAQGGFATTEIFPRMPHSFGDQYPYANCVSEVRAHPIRRQPAEAKFYTNTLQYNHAYWITIDRLTRHNADALLVANYKDGSLPLRPRTSTP